MTDDSDITAEEFDERIEEIETEDDMFEDEGDEDEPELMTFSDLLNLREDIAGVGDQLEETAGYYSEVTLILENQAEAADEIGESEKAAAITETAEKAKEVVNRIDNGEKLAEIREAVEQAEAEAAQ